MLPTNTRPAATVGCPDAVLAPANPKAHFSVSLGTCAAVRPAAFSFWKRVLAAPFPQPFHIGCEAMSGKAPLAGHLPTSAAGVATCAEAGAAASVAITVSVSSFVMWLLLTQTRMLTPAPRDRHSDPTDQKTQPRGGRGSGVLSSVPRLTQTRTTDDADIAEWHGLLDSTVDDADPRRTAGQLRDSCVARSRRHGRGLPRSRLEAWSRGRPQARAPGFRRRSRSSCEIRARGPDARRHQSSRHCHALWPGAGSHFGLDVAGSLSGDGARRGADAGGTDWRCAATARNRALHRATDG